MINKITFLLNQTLNKWNYDRFGFDILKMNGFDVSVFDLTPYEYPDIYKWNNKNENQVEGIEIILIPDMETAIDKISNISDDTFIVVLLTLNSKTSFIFQALSERNAKYAVSTAGVLPSLSKTGNPILHYGELLKECVFHPTVFSSKVKRKLINYKLKQFHETKIKRETLMLASGTKSINQYHSPSDKKTEILWLHQLDYDNYLREIALPYAVENKAVYLDTNMLHQLDALALNIRREGNVEVFYSNLNKLFDLIENDLDLSVEIAAHPRSTYNDKNNPFGKRPIYKFETARAVKESKLVIADQSTSVNYAVLFNKPIIFVISNEMRKDVKNSVYAFANSLGKNIINIDNIEPIDWDTELKINQECYITYRNNYIKTDKSPNLPFWQIVADRLKEM